MAPAPPWQINHDVLYKLMGDLDWTKIWAMGFAPAGSMVPKKSDRPSFKTDFYDAYFKAKEKKLLDKQNGKKNDAMTRTLAVLTHRRCIAIFSKIVPDAMTVRHAFSRWVDVNSYSRSISADGGAAYSMSNMSLMDLRQASTAVSLGKSTRKLQVALMGEFDAEAGPATGPEGGAVPGREPGRKAARTLERKKMTSGVLREVERNVPTDDDVVAGAMGSLRRGLHGAQMGKVSRIKSSGPAMRSIKAVLPEVKRRKELRDGLERHFADIVRAREKENEDAIREFEEEQKREFEDSTLRRRVTDRFGDTIEGGFELVGMTSLKALENVRMLSGMGPSGFGQRTRTSSKRPSLPR